VKGKAEKAVLIDEIHDRFAKAQMAVVAEYRGLEVEELRALRGKLRAVSAEFKVVKNTLARRAAEGTTLAGLREYFDGPVGVALGYGDPAPLAKALRDFAGQQEKLKLRIGLLEGRVLDVAGLTRVAALPTRQELLGRLVGRMHYTFYVLVVILQVIFIY
jgi:ribosomal protein L10